MNKNLFATILTYPAPSSNYRGESEENRTVLQKIVKGKQEYTVISPESMRNALREMLIKAGVPCNRTRLHNEDQLAVEFKDFPNADKYADDFLFGYMVADNEAIKKNKGRPSKRDSVLRMNLAVALTPYRFDATFHQSPLNAGASPWKNASTSALLHREVSHTAYQYPFALAYSDCNAKPEWTKALIQAISQLSDVAGGHARSYYEMAPKSVVARLTPNLVAGYDTYGFDEQGGFRELERIKASDLPGDEFWIGGEIVRTMNPEQQEYLENEGVHLYENPQKLLADLADAFLTTEAA
ncbi:type I-B CRISPR-associated protein Cas7/Cst2/DevR [Leptodesmis sichuanensis]|uniref:type I-B CRISPR-associated protein Cas7/Cst2/DevR n=1 Tax=Leptodesmis sichuanensis TaxID=2906798 RepID=UPI001F1A09B1|nr:type I-B CRISPR-associated protein Cas7/Cst2/DevR [Leptodesmis sichuanensis]UIE36494.1 type I-B CRISPR-associated protein Cas7/Cst2/DevR [Leptodesmis sichuanensis A121]